MRTSGAIIIMAVAVSALADTIAITEFMNDSSGMADRDGEWIEIHNYGSAPVDLTGWRLGDQDYDSMAMPSVTIGAGSFLVLSVDANAFQNDWNKGTIGVDLFQYSRSDLTLSNRKDELILSNASGDDVWNLAYTDDDDSGFSTFLSDSVISEHSFGYKSDPGVNRRGMDITSTLGYESNWETTDFYAYASQSGDWGSPFAGDYTAPIPTPTAVLGGLGGLGLVGTRRRRRSEG